MDILPRFGLDVMKRNNIILDFCNDVLRSGDYNRELKLDNKSRACSYPSTFGNYFLLRKRTNKATYAFFSLLLAIYFDYYADQTDLKLRLWWGTYFMMYGNFALVVRNLEAAHTAFETGCYQIRLISMKNFWIDLLGLEKRLVLHVLCMLTHFGNAAWIELRNPQYIWMAFV